MANQNTMSLKGEWKLSGKTQKKNGKAIECLIEIPGDIHSALLKNSFIPDPYYGFNEQEILWVGKNDWTIERDFDYKKIPDTKAIIELKQADTFFTLFINGKKAGSGKNQFARHRFDISGFLKDGKNSIKILFESAENKAEEINKTLPYPVPYMKYDVYSPNRNLVRKCQCHGGWDWGPCIMVSGIYDDVTITTVADGIPESLNYQTAFTKKTEAEAEITLEYQAFDNCEKDFVFKLWGKNLEETSVKVHARLKKGKNEVSAKIKVKNPETWKTNGELKEKGLKENINYQLEVLFEDSKCGTQKIEKKLYFSTLKAISIKEEGENAGRSLYFQNNGRRIFAKGSNWIPSDALPSRMTEERYQDLLFSAAEANQNCIRVWGGGIYEKDIFYDLCDRLGIIVWQDCMFACSTYPVTEEFFDEVTKELEYQIPRLKSHACIALWCGNNENFGALNWFKESNENRDRYIIDYDRLYNGLIGKKIKELDSTRLYWPSSPCSGPDDFADNWHSDNMGDMHYWSVWHERKSFAAYLSIKPRFVSEFGYESFPSINCIRSFAEEKDFNFTSRLMEYHQRSPSGNSIMIENFSRYFKFPSGFENMIYLSQVQQAVAIRTAVDWWRSLNPHCMGTLIWQLNDVWPGPSWSSLEYDGKWKLLHYESKKFFENVYMPLFEKDGKARCVICNETSERLEATIELQFLNFDGTEHFSPVTKNVKINGDTTKEAYSFDLDNSKGEYFVYAKLNAKSQSGKTFCCENTLWSKVYKHCDIQKASLQAEVSGNGKEFKINISTDKPAFFVALDSTSIPGIFDKNLLTLLPNEKVEISFKAKKDISAEELKKVLIIKDLAGSF